MRPTYRLATLDDARIVGANLRESDREELALSYGGDPLAATVNSVEKSVIAWAAVLGKTPIAVFGVGPYPSAERVGVIWMLATPAVADFPRELVVACRAYVRMMGRIYPRLINAVYAKNTRTRRWLRTLGFTEVKELPHYGVAKAPFVLIQYDHPTPDHV